MRLISAQQPPSLKFEVASVKPAALEHDAPTPYRNGPTGPKWIATEY